jgi:hypothetical protein
MRFSELVETIRRIDSVRWARGGYVYSVTIQLSDGRAIRYYEAGRDGRVTVCEASRRRLRCVAVGFTDRGRGRAASARAGQ